MRKMFLFIAAVMCAASINFVQAENRELTVYDGTATNSYVPYYGFYGDAYLRAQYVIPASKLRAINDHNIITLRYSLTNEATAWTSTVQVFIKEVDYTSIDVFDDLEGAQKVYEGTLSCDDNGVMSLTLASPYTYHGGNLLIAFDNVELGDFATSTFKGLTVTGASVQGFSYRSLAEVNPTQRDFIPQTTFVCDTEVIPMMEPIVEDDGWVHFDNGSQTGIISPGYGEMLYWGILIPAGTVTNPFLTKVSIYVSSIAHGEATIYIYQGGPTPSQANLLHSQDVSLTANNAFQEITLEPTVMINTLQDVWIVFESANSVATYCDIDNAIDGRWTKDGIEWMDVKVASEGGIENIAWMIRGLFEFGPFASDVQTSDVSLTTAKITWAGNAEAYDLLIYMRDEESGPYVLQNIVDNIEAFEYTLTELSQATDYAVRVVPHGFVTPTGDVTIPLDHYLDVFFTTPTPCEVKPVVEASEIEEKSAKISWRGFVDNYNLRYKKVTFFCDFENGIDGWTTMDADGDGYNWFWSGNDHCGYGSTPPFSGQYTVISESYDNAIYEKLTPDNYLITPQIEFGDTLSFWHRASNPAYPDDTVAVLVATKDNPAVEDFTAIAEFHTNGNRDYTQEVIPLEGYSGLGHIAFRHYNSYDHYRVEIDDVMVSDAEWTEMSNVTSPTVLNDLMPNTMYVVQVQIICDGEPGDWSETLTFTTLEEGTGIEQIVDSRESKVDSRKILHEGNLYILRDGKIFNAQGARVK